LWFDRKMAVMLASSFLLRDIDVKSLEFNTIRQLKTSCRYGSALGYSGWGLEVC